MSGHDNQDGRRALAVGAPLDHDPSLTLSDLLERAAGGEHGVLYLSRDGESRQSYAELRGLAECVGAALSSSGITPGRAALLVVAEPRQFLAAFWGCVWAGVVAAPCPIAVNFDDENDRAARKLESVWRALGAAPVIAAAVFRPALEALGRRRGLVGFTVLVLEELLTVRAMGVRHHADPDDLALLLLTSGSTGRPKLVMQSHRAIVARSAASAQINRFGPDEISLNWFPFDHVGGLVMFHLHDVFLTCWQIQVSMDLVLEEPLRWLDWIERFRVTVTWAPNFAFALIVDRETEIKRRRWDLSSLRFLLNGGEPIVARHARRFLTLLAAHGLPITAMRPAWGMSETCSGVTFDDAFTLETSSDDDQFVCVGRPVPGTSIRVVGEDGALLTEGVIGHLQVRGLTVTTGYFGEGAQGFTDDGWLCTGDRAFIADGRLTIAGRDKDVLIINGLNFATQEIETPAATVLGAEPTSVAAVALRRASDATDELALFFVPRLEHDASMVADRIRRRVLDATGLQLRIVVPLAELPRTSLGKIERAELRRRLAEGVYDGYLAHAKLRNRFYRRVWQQRQSAPAQLRGRWLVLGGTKPFSDECIMAEPGHCFERLATGRFRFRVDKRNDYLRLFQEAGALDGIAYMLQAPLESFLHLVQVLATHRQGRAPLQLVVVTRGAQAAAPTEVGDCAGAALLGLARAVGQELPWLRVRLIDLDAAFNDLADELAGGVDDEIAFRDGQRWVVGLEPAELAPSALKVEAGRFYLVTGGMGAVGFGITRWLAARGARLLVIGRRPICERQEHWQALERAGALYCATDVANEGALRAAVARAESAFSTRLDGIFHVAGELAASPALALSQTHLESALHAKAVGTEVLDALLAERQGRLFVAIGSVNGYLGGAGVAAYAAASAYQLAFGAAQARRRSFASYTVALSMCGEAGQGIGMSQGHSTELAAARGFSTLSTADVVQALETILASAPGVYLVGLDLSALTPCVDKQPIAAQPSDEWPKLTSAVAAIWRDVLDLDEVGLDENFFDLGGHSLLVPQLCGRIGATFARTIAQVEIFRHPTVRGLVDFLAGAAHSPPQIEVVRERPLLWNARRGSRS